MPDFKMTVIFGAQSGGWTESWFLTAADFSAADVQAFQYLDARAKCLSQGAFIDAVRVVSTLSVGQSDFSDIPPPYTQQRRIPQARDTITNTVVFRTQSLYGSRRMFEMSGIDDLSIYFDVDAGKMLFTDFFRGRADQFMNAIIAIPVRISCITKQDTTVNQKMINEVQVNGAGVIRIVIPAHGFALNDEVRISRTAASVRDVANGVWRVKAATADTFDIYNPAAETLRPGAAGGLVRRRVRRLESITSGGPLRVGSRKRGRAFFLPVGRRRAR